MLFMTMEMKLLMYNMTNDFKQEIVSEIALQLLPTVYDKAIESFENSGSVYYGHWTDNVVAESFKLAEAYYNYQEKYLKEVLE